ncbi:hypothetical protein F4824DRAFT_510504 [Ustulina deusta]|nr:hypothetical protein F4824DRAFT_510504 [Ustulina deusta]
MEGESGTAFRSRANLSSLPCWDHLTASLDAIRSLEDCSSMKTYPLAPNPGIQVKDTLIPLPLSEGATATIKEHSEQAAIGGESPSATDTHSPNVWALSSDQFDLLNPTWPSFLNTILDDVRTQLSIAGPVDAKLHKLILYDPGSFFQPRNDEQREEPKIAKLFIRLPSAHRGGQVRLSHVGQHRTYDIGELSVFETTALAWSSNVTPDLGEVVSGHLLVLSYDITSRLGWQNSTESFDQQVDNIDHALLQCCRQLPDFSTRSYLLDHKYLHTELSFSQLKGRDRPVCESLRRSCSQHGLYLFLGHCGNRIDRGSDGDAKKARPHLFSLNTLDGEEIAMYRSLSEDQLLNDSCHEGRRTEEFEPIWWTGPDTNKHYETAIIICPRLHLVSYLELSAGSKWSDIVTMMMNDLDNDSDSNVFLRDSLGVLEKILNGGHADSLRPDVLQWAWREKYLGLYAKLVLKSMQLPNNRPDMNAIAQIINNDILEETAVSRIIQWDKFFVGTIGQIKSLDAFLTNLVAVRNAIRPDLQPFFKAWQLVIQKYALDNKETLGMEDEKFITQLVMQSPEGSAWVSRSLIPVLRERGDKTLIRFLAEKLLSNNQPEKPTNAREIAGRILLGTNWKAALGSTDICAGHCGTVAIDFLRLLGGSLRADCKNMGIGLLDASWNALAAQHTAPNNLPLTRNGSNIAVFLESLARDLQGYNVPYLRSTREMFKLLIRQYMHVAVPLSPKKFPGQKYEEFEHAVDIYKKELLDFERPFKRLRLSYIKELLGEGDYRELVMLERVENSEGSKEIATVKEEVGLKRLADKAWTTGMKLPAKIRKKT